MLDGEETVAFVTGASRGIGRIIATALAADGAAVAGFARRSDNLDSLPSEGVVPFAIDVTDPVAVETSFAAAAARLGPPTLLVTCAGSADALGPIAESDPERWWGAVEVDLRGTMLCARRAHVDVAGGCWSDRDYLRQPRRPRPGAPVGLRRGEGWDRPIHRDTRH